MNKKEAIRQYKDTVQPMGIYQIKNLANGKVFIDSSKNLNGSKNSHMFQLKMDVHRNTALQSDYAKFGEDRFVFEILDELKPKKDAAAGYDYSEDLETLKGIWLEKLQPFGEKGYN